MAMTTRPASLGGVITVPSSIALGVLSLTPIPYMLVFWTFVVVISGPTSRQIYPLVLSLFEYRLL